MLYFIVLESNHAMQVWRYVMNNNIKRLIILLCAMIATLCYANNVASKDSKQTESNDNSGIKLRGNAIVIDNSSCNTHNSLSDKLKTPSEISMIKDNKECDTQSH